MSQDKMLKTCGYNVSRVIWADLKPKLVNVTVSVNSLNKSEFCPGIDPGIKKSGFVRTLIIKSSSDTEYQKAKEALIQSGMEMINELSSSMIDEESFTLVEGSTSKWYLNPDTKRTSSRSSNQKTLAMKYIATLSEEAVLSLLANHKIPFECFCKDLAAKKAAREVIKK